MLLIQTTISLRTREHNCKRSHSKYFKTQSYINNLTRFDTQNGSIQRNPAKKYEIQTKHYRNRSICRSEIASLISY